MFKNWFFIAVLFTGFFACKSRSAFKYSEAMVDKERSLSLVLEAAETKIEKYIAAKEYDSIATVSEDMEKLVQQKMDELNGIPVPAAKEADNFKAGMLRYFSYIKRLYTGYKKFGQAGTDEERQQAAIDQRKLVDEKPDVLRDIRNIQRKYADANGFKIE